MTMNKTVCNLFVRRENLEYITSMLVDYPVVVKEIGNVFRVQVMCYFVGYKKNYLELNFYDAFEADYYYVKIDTDKIIRSTIFSAVIEPDEWSAV